MTFPIIADPKRDTAALLGMLDEDEKDAPGIPATVRKVGDSGRSSFSFTRKQTNTRARDGHCYLAQYFQPS